jgi:hypothetical protein
VKGTTGHGEQSHARGDEGERGEVPGTVRRVDCARMRG